MAEQVSPARVLELVRMANSLTSDEFYILVGAFGLNIAQNITCEYIVDDPEDYVKDGVFKGEDLWDNAAAFMDDWTCSEELTKHVNKYKLGQFYDIEVTQTVVATPKKV